MRGRQIPFQSVVEIREAIEPIGARLAALNRTADDLRRIEDICERLEARLGSVKDYLAENLKWHVAVIEASHNELLIGFMRALVEAGYKVPGDISVMGFDSTGICELCTPRLTSMRLPLEAIGAAAAERLLQQIREEAGEPVTTLLPVHLDIRDSTGPAPL